MARPTQKRIVMIAGPNGAGKTTFATEYLPKELGVMNFINADLIAAGLSPFNPEAASVAAGRIMSSEIKRLLSSGEDFSFETTLSSLRFFRWIPMWRLNGYRVELNYLQLADVEMAVARVSARVRHGGHRVPETDIRRRFSRSLSNFETCKSLVDRWRLFDNSGTRIVAVDEGGAL